MQISNRMPKAQKTKVSKRSNKKTDNKFFNKLHKNNSELNIKNMKQLSHTELREVQRYGTLSVNKREIINDIYNDKAVIIDVKDNIIKALVRYSSRYYIVIFDVVLNVIKTFLPDDNPNFLDYVQMYVDKENSTKMLVAA